MSMQDTRLIFSDSQTLTTDVRSDNYVDMEEFSVVDQQITGWLCLRIITATSLTNDCLSVHLVTTDTASGAVAADPVDDPTTDKGIVSICAIPVAEIVAGASFCVGFLADDVREFIRAWFDDEGGTIGGTLIVDCWIQDQPITKLKTQKMPS